MTGGFYIKGLYPDLCSAEFVLEFSKGRGKIFGSFREQSFAAGVYGGELLGLVKINLMFLAVNKVNPTLQGRAQIFTSGEVGIRIPVEHSGDAENFYKIWWVAGRIPATRGNV